MSPLVRLDALQQTPAINLLKDPGYQPGPIVIPNCAAVTLVWTLTDGRTAHNNLFASYTGSPALSNALAQTLFAAFTTGAGWTAFAAYLIPTAALSRVTLLDIRSSTGILYQSTGTAVPGTSTGSALPDEIALAVRFVTPNRGPSGRGRAYLPGFATTAIGAGGVVLAGTVTAAQTWMANVVFPAITSNLGAPVLGLRARAAYTSPTTGRQFPARAAQTVTITNVLVPDNHWDSQRRRGLK